MVSITPSKSQQALRLIVWLLALHLTTSTTLAQSVTTGAANVLIYSATREYRHDSISTAVEALKSRSAGYNITFDNTEDLTWFRDDGLGKYDAIVFLSTTGEILDTEGKTAFQNYLNKGGNFAGIHSSSDSLNTTAFFGREVGAYFDYHPPISRATVNVLTKDHPSTSMLPDRWEVTDEMYNFKSDPRNLGAVVILSADESTYTDPGPRRFDHGDPHPTAWYQEKGAGVENDGLAGRSFYTSLGHLNETWQNELFLSHVFGGITWVLASGTTKASNSSASLGKPPTTTGTNSPSSLPNPSDRETSPSAPPPSPSILITGLIAVLLRLNVLVWPFGV